MSRKATGFCQCGSVLFAKGMCKRCYMHIWQRQHNKKLFEAHPEKVKENLGSMFAGLTCKIIQKHHNELKDDPEHLSTEFILKMSRGVKRERK